MSRADRRRFEREFSKIRNTETCTVCSKKLQHNTRTVAGLTADGRTVLVGECCLSMVRTPLLQGLFTRGVDVPLAHERSRAPTNQNITREDVDQALDALQAQYTKLDSRANAVMRQAGLGAAPHEISLADTPWKADDAAWFKQHPARSHRLRLMLPGEAATLPAEITNATLPPNHRLDILIRQVVPGNRIRTVFCRNTGIDIPDKEEFIHAIFDIVAQAGRSGIIDAERINARARQYLASGAQLPN